MEELEEIKNNLKNNFAPLVCNKQPSLFRSQTSEEI